MNLAELNRVANMLVTPGKGVLAADESAGTVKKRFDVIGRIQMRFEDGFWNEWYLWFEDGSDGWLSDASGQYAVTRRRSAKTRKALPAFADIRPGLEINLDGQRFVA